MDLEAAGLWRDLSDGFRANVYHPLRQLRYLGAIIQLAEIMTDVGWYDVAMSSAD